MIWLAVLALAVAWVDPDDFEIAGTRYKTFPSKAAGSEVSYLIYLPPSYAAEPERRFPVVYWLHRADGSQRTGAPFVALIDQEIRAGSLKPLIVVLVNGIRRMQAEAKATMDLVREMTGLAYSLDLFADEVDIFGEYND